MQGSQFEKITHAYTAKHAHIINVSSYYFTETDEYHLINLYHHFSATSAPKLHPIEMIVSKMLYNYLTSSQSKM